MQHVVNVKTKSDLTYSAQPELIEARYCEPARIRQVWDQNRVAEKWETFFEWIFLGGGYFEASRMHGSQLRQQFWRGGEWSFWGKKRKTESDLNRFYFGNMIYVVKVGLGVS